MPAILFRCPGPGPNVQGWVAEDPAERDENSHEAAICHAGRRVHLVDPRTGKVAGGADET